MSRYSTFMSRQDNRWTGQPSSYVATKLLGLSTHQQHAVHAEQVHARGARDDAKHEAAAHDEEREGGSPARGTEVLMEGEHACHGNVTVMSR